MKSERQPRVAIQTFSVTWLRGIRSALPVNYAVMSSVYNCFGPTCTTHIHAQFGVLKHLFVLLVTKMVSSYFLNLFPNYHLAADTHSSCWISFVYLPNSKSEPSWTSSFTSNMGYGFSILIGLFSPRPPHLTLTIFFFFLSCWYLGQRWLVLLWWQLPKVTAIFCLLNNSIS